MLFLLLFGRGEPLGGGGRAAHEPPGSSEECLVLFDLLGTDHRAAVGLLRARLGALTLDDGQPRLSNATLGLRLRLATQPRLPLPTLEGRRGQCLRVRSAPGEQLRRHLRGRRLRQRHAQQRLVRVVALFEQLEERSGRRIAPQQLVVQRGRRGGSLLDACDERGKALTAALTAVSIALTAALTAVPIALTARGRRRGGSGASAFAGQLVRRPAKPCARPAQRRVQRVGGIGLDGLSQSLKVLGALPAEERLAHSIDVGPREGPQAGALGGVAGLKPGEAAADGVGERAGVVPLDRAVQLGRKLRACHEGGEGALGDGHLGRGRADAPRHGQNAPELRGSAVPCECAQLVTGEEAEPRALALPPLEPADCRVAEVLPRALKVRVQVAAEEELRPSHGPPLLLALVRIGRKRRVRAHRLGVQHQT